MRRVVSHPAAPVLGVALCGLLYLAAVAATAAFAPLARSFARGHPARAAAATWLFAAGVLANVVIGRMPFTVGIALAVAAWLCGEKRRGAWYAAAAVPA